MTRALVSSLVAELASDVETLDDDEDWEMEGLDKSAVVTKLRELLTEAMAHWNANDTILVFRSTSSPVEQLPSACENVDVSRGVIADMQKDGAIVSLRFDLTHLAARSRLDKAGIFPCKPSAAENLIADLPRQDDSASPCTAAKTDSLMLEQMQVTILSSALSVDRLVLSLANEIESRDDDDDWESE